MSAPDEVQVLLGCGHTTYWPRQAAVAGEFRWCNRCGEVQKLERWWDHEWRAACVGLCSWARWYGQARPASVPHRHPVTIEYTDLSEKSRPRPGDDGMMSLFDTDAADEPPPF